MKKRLRNSLGDRLVAMRVFGSYARGHAHEDSDVDVLIVIDEAGWPERNQAGQVAGDIFAETGVLLSATVFDRAVYEMHRRQQRPLVMDAEREGVSV